MAPKQKWQTFNPFLTLEPGLIVDLTNKTNKCCSPKVTESTEVKTLNIPIPIPSTPETKQILEDATNDVCSKMSTMTTEAKNKQLMWFRTKRNSTVGPWASAEDPDLKKVKFDIPIPKPRRSVNGNRVSDNKVEVEAPNAFISNPAPAEKTAFVADATGKSVKKSVHETVIELSPDPGTKITTDIKSDKNMVTLVSRNIGTENTPVRMTKQHNLFRTNFVYPVPEVISRNSNPTRIDMKSMTPNSGSRSRRPRRSVQFKTDRNSGLRKTDLKPHENNSMNYGQTRRTEKALDGQLGLTLLGCGLEKYHDNFKRNQISYLDFLRLGNDDLLDMGVLNLEDRRKLCKLIKEISGTAYPDQGKIPDRIRRKLLESESIGMMTNTVEHLQQITGDEKDENNCGVTKILELVKKNPLSLKDDSVLDPVGVVIGAAKEVEKGCKMLAKETKDLRAEYQKPKSIPSKSKEREIVSWKEDGKNLGMNSSIPFFMQQEFLAATIILAVGTLSFYGLKKLLPLTNE